jgi:Holliday junction DNA helicase RuvA
VGPKAALGVLDVLSPGELAQAVARDDKAAVGRANGVGPKLAQRIVAELKDKQLGEMGLHLGAAVAPVTPIRISAGGEAVSALMGLGIPEASARRAVDQVLIRLGDDTDVATVIRGALQELDR